MIELKKLKKFCKFIDAFSSVSFFLNLIFKVSIFVFVPFSFPLEEFIYNYLITLSFYIIPKKGV